MNELVTKWVEALRSGRYVQEISATRRDWYRDKSVQHYSALGVLCDIVNPQGWQRTPRIRECYRYSYKGQEPEIWGIPQAVAELAGLRDRHGAFTWWKFPDEEEAAVYSKVEEYILKRYMYEDSSLHTLNSHKTPFSVIADVIELRPPGLFTPTKRLSIADILKPKGT